MSTVGQALPIDDVLGALRSALAESSAAVLVAPPGAGKTTRAPLALLDEAWAKDKRLILLEPRRLAARAAASRMAANLGERVGETIGLRVRFESLASARTRIEVVTEGVYTRMILDDPSLEGVGAVLFDEFHERSLDADLGLALTLDAQQGLREDLRILVMSATLDGARVRALLGEAPLIESAGRAWPVVTHYAGRDPRLRIEDEVARVTLTALDEDSGSILVFLPGQGEIRRVSETLTARIRRPDVDIAPLYGAMDARAQDLAVAPAPAGRRKIVLATSIAETSLTIEGVRVVVDSGLMRVPRYEPDIGLTRLETVRVSRANADQRRGRAGRTKPGACYRLWEEAANGGLQPYGAPEILSADLSGLLLDCAAWGVADPTRLAFLDAPPRGALAEARVLLTSIGALDSEGRITDEGRAIARLALPPRLARMVVDAARRGEARTAGEVAVVLTERGLGGDAVDLTSRLEAFRRDRSQRADEARRLARRLAQTAEQAITPTLSRKARQETGVFRRPMREWGRDPSPARGRRWREAPDEGSSHASAGVLLASAYPDRIAMAHRASRDARPSTGYGKRGEFLMANGRAAALEPHDALAGEKFLAIGEIAGRAASAHILLAAALTLDDIEAVAGGSIETADELAFDRASAALRARRRRRLGALILAEQTLAVPNDEQSALALARGVLSLGVDRLPWSKALKQWRDRVMFLRRAEGEAWPDLLDEALAGDPAWLGPYLAGKTRLDEIGADDLSEALRALLGWDLSRRLEQEAPTHFRAPTGTDAPIDYEAQGGPTIALRVQELFGLSEHPAVAGGRIPLTLHLLSPAHRPIQITRDQPGFWGGSWAEVRSDLRGRYPRHFWPEDPASAPATNRAKPRGA
jgi:ATP-dependent helicase HrpB